MLVLVQVHLLLMNVFLHVETGIRLLMKNVTTFYQELATVVQMIVLSNFMQTV